MGIRIRYFRNPDQLLEFYHQYKDVEVAVTPHKNADTDAIASAILLTLILPKAKLYIQDKMNYPAKRLLQWMKERWGLLFEFKKLSQSQERLLIVVDTSGNAETYGKEVVALFDHHDIRGARFQPKYEFRNPEAPANALIMLEALEIIKDRLGLEIKPWAYDLAAIALISDTNRFDRGDKQVFEVMAELLNYANYPYEELKLVAIPPSTHADRERLEVVLGGTVQIPLDNVNIEEINLETNTVYLVVAPNLDPFAIVRILPPFSEVSPGDVTSDIMSNSRVPFVIYLKKVPEEGAFRISIRTSPPYNAVDFMRKHLGCTDNCGGHPRAGGGTFYMEEKELIRKILQGLKEEMRHIKA